MNEWMRHHKKIVLTFALLAMVGTAFYGVLYLVRGAAGAGRGPSGAFFALDGSRVKVEPEELYQERLLRWHWTRGPEYPGAVALKDMARARMAADMGFAVGDDELMYHVREDIKKRTSKQRVTPDLLKRLLDELQLTQNQYERLTREIAMVSKVVGLFQGQARTTEGEQYLDYSQRKQVVRIFYKEFQTKAYEELAGDPSPEEIKEYYERCSKPPGKNQRPLPPQDTLETEPALSVDVLYYAKAQVTKDWKPTDEELTKYYQQYRNFYKKEVEAGQPEPTGDAAFKPFEEVKAKVLEDFTRTEMQVRANEMKTKFEKEIAEEEKKAEDAGQKFDLAAFAEKHGLTYWRTLKLRKRGFEKGSQKIKAPDFNLAGAYVLFHLAQKGETETRERELVEERKKFSGAQRILYNTDEEGFVMFRLAEFTDKQLMNLEEATPVIKRRLREDRAREKALAEAKAFRDKWLSGEAVPTPEDLREDLCGTGSTNPLYRELSDSPVPVGELMEASFQLDEEERKDRPDTRRGRYLVGFIAERDCPSLSAFEMDTVSREGGFMASYKTRFRMREYSMEGYEFLAKSAAVELDSVPDLPLSSRGSEPSPPPPL